MKQKIWGKIICCIAIILFMVGSLLTSSRHTVRINPRVDTLQSGFKSYVIGECFHTADDSWLDTAIAIDKKYGVHLLYKSKDLKLVYVNKTGPTWTSTTGWTVPNHSTNYGGNNAIALDGMGNIHISSSAGDGGDEDLIYITGADNQWTVEEFYRPLVSVGLENDISVNSSGNVYITHLNYNADALLLTANTSGSWDTTIVEDDYKVVRSPGSLMLDNNQNLHVVYSGSSKLWHASWTGNTWIPEQIPLNPKNGVSAVIDENNNIFAVNSNGIAIYSNSQDQWSTENIFQQMLPGTDPGNINLDEDALVIDGDGYLHLCFLVQSGSVAKELSIYYASNLLGYWKAKLVDSWTVAKTHDFPPGLCVDNSGNVHLIYVKSDDYTVRYVTPRNHYNVLKNDCAANTNIFFEDFDGGFVKAEGPDQWSLNGNLWWFQNHVVPKVENSFLILTSTKNETDGSTPVKQDAQTMEEFVLPDNGELIVGFWSDRWAREPVFNKDYWTDSSVGLEIHIGTKHYAIVFTYGNFGVFYDPIGDCTSGEGANCNYKRIVEWSEISASDHPIALRISWVTEGGNKTFKCFIVTKNIAETEPFATIDTDPIGSQPLRIRLNANVTDAKMSPDIDSETLKIDYVCLRSDVQELSPVISLSRTQYNFGVPVPSPFAGAQALLIENTGGGTLNWTAAASDDWLKVYPSKGTGSGDVSISVDAAGLGAGIYTGTIEVSAPGSTNSPQSISITLKVYDSGKSSPPLGEFSTPIDGSTVRSSIPASGWALDDIGVESVKIYRDPVEGEGANMIYIGDAVFVEGARPDVEAAYPGYPMNYKAGWGYMMLTNFLPNAGNGTFRLHVIAADTEGNETTLGVKTITCDNANAVKPFGAIDTPAQGGAAWGNNYRNQGWVLTPMPNSIPLNGSTINVFVNGVNLGHPVYNIYRQDIANYFPGYANSDGALAYFDFDASIYENGIHTIYWTATDDAGNMDGIGSRYFSIYNSGRSGTGTQTANRYKVGNNNVAPLNLFQIKNIPPSDSKELNIKKGLRKEVVCPEKKGLFKIRLKEQEPMELELSSETFLMAGYMVKGNKLGSLPIGSTLDRKTNKFYWLPGPGFFGHYRLLFIEKNVAGQREKKIIIVTIEPRGRLQ